MFTSFVPSLCGVTTPDVCVVANSGALYEMMEPVVGFDDESVSTETEPERYQLPRML